MHIYFNCCSGISGDMIVASLIDLGVSLSHIKNELKKVDINGYELKKKDVKRAGMRALKFNVIIKKRVSFFVYHSKIKKLIANSGLSKYVKNTSLNIFNKIAVAESKIHGINVDNVHFHEVGSIDSIVDIIATAVCIEKLNVKGIFSSYINVGAPAPATIEILKNVPVYSTDSVNELTTPTGAAIIYTLVKKFIPIPLMRVKYIGYGAGSKSLEKPNVLITYNGKVAESSEDKIAMIETNIDNVSPQIYEYVMEKIFSKGALDVFFTPIIMKKTRPAVKLSVICETYIIRDVCDIIFSEIPTLGVRIYYIDRIKLKRKKDVRKTKWGKIGIKTALKNGKRVIIPEYEDCKKAALRFNIPLNNIIRSI